MKPLIVKQKEKFPVDLLYHNKNFKLACVHVVNGFVHLPTWRTQGASYIAKLLGPDEIKIFRRKFINPTINLYDKKLRYPCGRKRRTGFRWKLPLPLGLYEIQRPAPYWYISRYGYEFARIYLAFYQNGTFDWLSHLDALCYVYGCRPELLERYKNINERLDIIYRVNSWTKEQNLQSISK